MTGTPEELTNDPAKLGIKEAGLLPEVKVTNFAQIEAQVAKYGITRDDVVHAMKAPDAYKTFKDQFVFLVTKAMIAQMEHPNERTAAQSYPIPDSSSDPKKRRVYDDLIYLSAGQGVKQNASVSLTVRTDSDRSGAYTYSRTRNERSDPAAPSYEYKVTYTGARKAAIPRADGGASYGFKLGGDRENVNPRSAADMDGLMGRLGGLPVNFLAEAPRSLAEAAK